MSQRQRETFKREKCFREYKELRNKLKHLLEKGKVLKAHRRDNIIACVWRALDMYTKGHRSTSADVPKNLTAHVFNNHFLSVAESLIEPLTNVYE